LQNAAPLSEAQNAADLFGASKPLRFLDQRLTLPITACAIFSCGPCGGADLGAHVPATSAARQFAAEPGKAQCTRQIVYRFDFGFHSRASF
jgi:hypothetical protein